MRWTPTRAPTRPPFLGIHYSLSHSTSEKWGLITMEHDCGAMGDELDGHVSNVPYASGMKQATDSPLALERSIRVSIESQLLSLGVMLEGTIDAMEQQSGGFRAAVTALEQRNHSLQEMLVEREEKIRQADGEIKRLTVSRGVIARDLESLRDELSRVRASTSMRLGSYIVGSLGQPVTSLKLAVRLPRTLFREIKLRRAK